jgi:hypothetical protein
VVVDAIIASAKTGHEQRRGCGVYEDADARDDHHGPTRDRLRMSKPSDRFPRDCADSREQQRRVSERREDGRSPQPVRSTC